MFSVYDCKSIRTHEMSEHTFKSREDISIIHIFKELGYYLCISLRIEHISFFLESSFEFSVILDDTIVYNEESIPARTVWMTVGLCNTTMCRPTCMCDSCNIVIIFCVISLDLGCKNRYLAYCLLEKKMPIRCDSKYSSRVISTILEVSESLDEEWDRIFLTIVSKYSTHRFLG